MLDLLGQNEYFSGEINEAQPQAVSASTAGNPAYNGQQAPVFDLCELSELCFLDIFVFFR